MNTGYCRESDHCVCGGDTEGVRAGCHNWVKATDPNYERRATPPEPLDQPAELPPLPEPRAIRATSAFPKVYALAYTADQMQEYARLARAALRSDPVAATGDKS